MPRAYLATNSWNKGAKNEEKNNSYPVGIIFDR